MDAGTPTVHMKMVKKRIGKIMRICDLTHSREVTQALNLRVIQPLLVPEQRQKSARCRHVKQHRTALAKSCLHGCVHTEAQGFIKDLQMAAG